MRESNPIRDAVRYALTAGVAASFAGVPAAALAQDDVAVQDKVTVTGSRIKRVDIEGPSPISVISREDIDASGEISVAEVLRGTSFNTFGSFRQRSGSGAQSQSVVSLRGLGGQRTLVLIDGRRVTGSTTFNGGAGVNLNTIPLAAVERIEVLRDGASAIYGSDAIGGVINVIMRKDYEGMHLSYGVGRPTQTGGDEDSYSIVGGVSGAKGNVTFGFDNQQKEIIFQGDRSFSATGLSAFGYPGSYFAYLTTNDPRNPTGSFLSVGTFPDPRCPSSLGSAEFPASQLAPFAGGTGGLCQYNYAGVAANESENDTKSFFVNANYDINETTTFFARGTFTFNESFGRYAPSPFTSPLPTMTQGNVNNPTDPVNNPTNALGQPYAGQGADTDGDGTADLQGPFNVTLFYRNVPGGFRDTFVDDTLVDYLAGVQGTVDWLGGMDWEFGAQYSQQKSDAESPGLGLAAAIQSQINSGSLDIFAANTDTGDFSQGLDSGFVAGTQAAAATSINDNETRIASFDFTVNFDAFQMETGPVPVALGVEYRDEDFNQNFDEQANAGGLQGTSGGADASGARAVKAIFGETTIPVLSMVDLNLAARWEDYNDFGTTFNPKISASFRPLDSLLIRASWGQGFRAPSMTELYSSTTQSFNGAIDTLTCSTSPTGNPTTGRDTTDPTGQNVPPGNPCRLTQYQNFQAGNRNLGAEESSSWNLGLVWNPLDDLSLAFDWFDIELEDEIGFASMQGLFDEEFALRQGGDTGVPFSTVAGGGASGVLVGSVVRNPNNLRLVTVLRPNTNFAKRETDGLDFEGSYAFSLGQVGDFRATTQWTYINEYERDEADGLGLRDPQFFDPEHRGTIGLNWALGDFGANLLFNYIADSSIEDANGIKTNDLDDYQTWDLSATYATPWNGTVTVGARNIFDEDPPTSVGIGSPFYTNQLHDVYGRVPYVRYEQDL